MHSLTSSRSFLQIRGIVANAGRWLCLCLTGCLLAGSAPKLMAGVYNFQATIQIAYDVEGADSYSQLGNLAIYVPPAVDVPRVRGIIFLLPGSGGDWRFRVNDTVWQEAARSLGFALVGVDQNFGVFYLSGTGAQSSLNSVLASAAAATGRAELVNVPVVWTGFSLGGFGSSEWARRCPSQTLAIVAQHGGNYYDGATVQPPQKVPSLWLAGSADTTVSPDYLSTCFLSDRSASVPGGQSALAIDWYVGHDAFVDQGWSMAWTWIAESIALRYPANTVPSTTPGNPITPLDIPLSSGWLGWRSFVGAPDVNYIGETSVITGSDINPFCSIAPYASYGGVATDASWLPNETVARVYQAFNSTDGLSSVRANNPPLQGPLEIVGPAVPGTAIQTGQSNPPQMAVLPLGSTINIGCNTRGFGGPELVTLSGSNLISNGDFSLWTSGKPTAWAGGTAGLSQGPDLLSTTGTSAVLCNNASLQQTFSPLASDFQMRFTFTMNLTSGTTGWNQPLVLNLYQSNQAVNPSYPWMTFQFAAADVSAGPFTVAAYAANTGSNVILVGPPIVGSTYDFAARAFTGTPAKYDFVLNYFAATNTYSVSYGPSGGPLVSSGQIAYFRNPTNATFGGINSVFFYSYVNGLALDGVSLSPILSSQSPVQRMDYYDGSTLIGTQTTTGTAGWGIPYTLNTQGIRSLTAVATSTTGSQTSAFRTVVVEAPHQSGTTYYRFEQSPGLLTDQYDLLSLTGTTALGPVQVALSGSGAGSAFPRYFTFPYGNNDSASKFQVANNDGLNVAPTSALPSGTTPFTVEAFVNLATSGAGGLFRTIAAQGNSGVNCAWQLIVTGEGSGQGPRRLVLQTTTTGSNNTLDTQNSGFTLLTGVDYYVAMSINPSDKTASGITFYMQNLTTGGPLQVAHNTHVNTSIFTSAGNLKIGSGWDGLLDEVRITNQVLAPSALLINQAGLPTPGGVTAGVGLNPGEIQLSWSPVASATNYIVERSTSLSGSYVAVAQVSSPNYVDTGLLPSQQYYYQISAAAALVSSTFSTPVVAQPFLPQTFAGWRYLHFHTNSSTPPTDVLSDPDGDGMNNLLEYAMGTDPNDPTSVARPICSQVAAGGPLQLTFQRIADPALTYTVQASNDLGGWTSIWTSTGSANTAGAVTVTDSVSSGSRRFLRLQVTY